MVITSSGKNVTLHFDFTLHIHCILYTSTLGSFICLFFLFILGQLAGYDRLNCGTVWSSLVIKTEETA